MKQSNLYMLSFVFVLSVLSIGCASAPSQEQLDTADYGSPISQLEAERKAKVWLKGHLKDPNSAEIDWGVVEPGWIRDAPIQGGGFVFGYRLDSQVNAKNSFGGYTGYKPYIFLFYYGEFKRILGQDELDQGVTYLRRWK